MTETGRNERRRRLAVALSASGVLLALCGWLLEHRPFPQRVAPAAVPATAGTHEIDRTGVEAGRANTGAADTRSAAKHHPSEAISLPPADAPLAQTYSDLRALADAGDAGAASRLFTETRRCLWARDSVRAIPNLLDTMVNTDTAPLDAEQLTAQEHQISHWENQLAKARDLAQSCEGLSDSELLLAPVTWRAAQLGDVNAANCYVGGMMFFAGGLLDHPEWLAEYKSSALTIAQQALERGDWQMVAQLQDAYAGNRSLSPLGQVTGAAPAQNYRLLRLLRLGARDRDVARLDRDLAAVAQTLAAPEVADGDAWAERMFRENFNSRPVPLPDSDLHSCSF